MLLRLVGDDLSMGEHLELLRNLSNNCTIIYVCICILDGAGKRSLCTTSRLASNSLKVSNCQKCLNEGFIQQLGGIGMLVLSLLFGLVSVVAMLVILWRRSVRVPRNTSAIGRNGCMGGEEDS